MARHGRQKPRYATVTSNLLSTCNNYSFQVRDGSSFTRLLLILKFTFLNQRSSALHASGYSTDVALLQWQVVIPW